MKKLFLILVILSSAFFSLNAQTGFAFGFRFMPSASWLMYSDTVSSISYDVKNKPVFAIGPSVKYSISDNFNFDVSAIFGGRKFTIEQKNEEAFKNDSIDMVEDIKLKFVQLPLNLNGQFDIIDNLQGVINFGVNLGFFTNSTRLVTNNFVSGGPQDYVKFKNIIPLNIELVGGLGVDYEISNNLHSSFTAQYSNGIVDIWSDKKGAKAPSKIENLTLKTRNIVFNLGFYVNF